MIRRQTISTLSAAAILLSQMLFSQPVNAIDLTGTWSGKVACNGYDGAKFSGQLSNQVLKISQIGNHLSMQWLDQGKPFNDYVGFVIEDRKQPATKGGAALTACTSSLQLDSGFSEIASLTVSASQGGKGKLTGFSIYSDNMYGLEVTQCKWTFKMTSNKDPNVVAGCETPEN